MWLLLLLLLRIEILLFCVNKNELLRARKSCNCTRTFTRAVCGCFNYKMRGMKKKTTPAKGFLSNYSIMKRLDDKKNWWWKLLSRITKSSDYRSFQVHDCACYVILCNWAKNKTLPVSSAELHDLHIDLTL